MHAEAPVTGSREFAARVHLEVERCQTCIADYTRHLRYLRSARFTDKVGQLLPAPVLVEHQHQRRRTGARDLISDWIARLLSHDPAGAAHLAVSGRTGLTGALAAQLAAFCTAGAICVSVSTVLVPARAISSTTSR